MKPRPVIIPQYLQKLCFNTSPPKPIDNVQNPNHKPLLSAFTPLFFPLSAFSFEPPAYQLNSLKA